MQYVMRDESLQAENESAARLPHPATPGQGLKDSRTQGLKDSRTQELKESRSQGVEKAPSSASHILDFLSARVLERYAL